MFICSAAELLLLQVFDFHFFSGKIHSYRAVVHQNFMTSLCCLYGFQHRESEPGLNKTRTREATKIYIVKLYHHSGPSVTLRNSFIYFICKHRLVSEEYVEFNEVVSQYLCHFKPN